LVYESMAMRTGDGVSRDPDRVVPVGGGLVERTLLGQNGVSYPLFGVIYK